jgi:GR25 family glycosyltransferase involved in LPS biosynthesis
MMPYMSRFSAVDGQNVERDALVKRGIITANLDYSDGALGNALSHVMLWDTAIRENRSVTICEDDAIFNRLFCTASEAVLKELPVGWHMILWGWNFDSLLWFDMIPGVSSCIGAVDQQSMRQRIDAFRSADVRPHPFKLFQTFGTVCYSISPAGALVLRQCCLPLRNMSIYFPALGRAVFNRDLGIGLNSAYSHIQAFVSFPPLVVTRNEHANSTVQSPAGSPRSK